MGSKLHTDHTGVIPSTFVKMCTDTETMVNVTPSSLNQTSSSSSSSSLPTNISEKITPNSSHISTTSASQQPSSQHQSLIRSQFHRNLEVYANSSSSSSSSGSNKNNNNNNNHISHPCENRIIKENNNANNSFPSQERKESCVEISRDVIDLDTFAHMAGGSSSTFYMAQQPKKTFNTRVNSLLKQQSKLCCKGCSIWNTTRSVFPILRWLPKYSLKNYLLADIIAGITVAILHIPQGIAYSLLAGLGPVNGLYVSFFPVLVYTFMGTSPHISVGTFAVASIMLNNIATKMGAINEPVQPAAAITGISSDNVIFEVTTQMFSPSSSSSSASPPLNESSLFTTDASFSVVMDSPTTPLRTIEVLTSVCLLCGFIQFAMGFFRLGSLSLILSEHLVSAFSTAIAFHVATSQFTYIFGFETLPRAKSGPFKLIKSWMIIYENMRNINLNCLIFSAVIILILVTFKEVIEPRLKKRNSFHIPIDLLLVIFSILMSWLFKFNRNFSIQVVKKVPTGLPQPAIPRVDLMPSLFVDTLILSIVCFAVSLSLAKIFAKKHNYRVDANQELIALGSANMFSSFFLCYPCSAALSRSTLQERVGGKTQIAGLVSCGIIFTVLLLLAPYLYHLPKCTLSCIILVALKSMFMQISDLRLFWRISKLDGATWFITFSSVIILDIDLGLIVGISTSILSLLIRLAVPRMYWLGQLATTEIYAEKEAYPGLNNYPGIKIIRFGSPLFYLNVEVFKDKVMNAFPINLKGTTDNLTNNSHDEMKKTLIIDLSGVSFVDKSGIDALVEVIRTLQKNKINTSLAMCPFHVVTSLERIHFDQLVKHSIHPCKLYPTIHDAVIDSL